MCLNKIISEFEIECSYGCGARVKKGDLQIHLKNCPEKLFECAECGKLLKKDTFKYHISREHPDTMFQKFVIDQDTQNGQEESKTEHD